MREQRVEAGQAGMMGGLGGCGRWDGGGDREDPGGGAPGIYG